MNGQLQPSRVQMSSDVKAISWRRVNRDMYVASIGGIALRIKRNGSGAWTLAIDAAVSTIMSLPILLVLWTVVGAVRDRLPRTKRDDLREVEV